MSISRTLPIIAPAECACEGGSLDKLIQPAILVVLAKGPLHGYRLAERIGEMPMFGGQKPDVSGIYRFLRTMEKQGMVEASWDMGERGPAKKSYRITPAGESCLGRWIKTLEHHRRGITELLRAARTVVEPRNRGGGARTESPPENNATQADTRKRPTRNKRLQRIADE